MRSAHLVLVAALALTALVGAHPAAVTMGQGDSHPAGACSAPYHVSGAGWDFCWQQDNPRVQGLEITRAYFQGQSVIWRMGVPFTLTQYETTGIGPFKDTLGTPGSGVPGYGLGALPLQAESCPRFFGGQGELLHNNRVCVEHRDGQAPAVAIWSRFNVFNYRFLQGWVFDSGGNIEPILSLGGRLIDGASIGAHGTNHYHHVYWRIDFDIAAEGNDMLQVFQRATGGLQGSGAFSPLGPCILKGFVAAAAWCDIPVEGKMVNLGLAETKWRVMDTVETNSQGRHQSYEWTVRSNSPPGPFFGSFDVMLVEYKGDSSQIGYEVPTNPERGDEALNPYWLPPETVSDPVVWIMLRAYHDTRDEERGSMVPHHVHLDIRPNNFVGTNPGESTYPWN